jgi:3-hydroxybutyryl-CoA dehydrogenase
MQIGVIGLGTMGLGIVQVALQNGCTVKGYDAYAPSVESAATRLASTFSKLAEKGKISQEQATKFNANFSAVGYLSDLANCDLVIEAVVENLDIKKKIFSELDALLPEQSILATNTSSLSVTSIAAACKHAHRVVGIHFFNPAPLMALVEIIPAIQTSSEVLQSSKTIIDSWGKTTVIAKDTPGFIVNRIARPYYSEAIRIYEEGQDWKEIIDIAMQLEGFKMGPFALMDMIGHDVNYVVTETVWQSMFYDPRYKPSFSQKRLLEAGWLGKKSGRGFYDYGPNAIILDLVPDFERCKEISTRILLMLFNEAADALFLGIASEADIETAMTKGVNYPKGLLAWAREFGIANVVNGLDKLYNRYREDRYRCSVYLRDLAAEA